MALLKTWTVSFACFLLLVIVALYRHGRPSVTHSPVTFLSNDPTEYEMQHTHQPEPPYEDQTDAETHERHADYPVLLPEDRKDNETQIDTADAIHQRLVVLTAFSSNHFREAQDMIGSMQKYLPHAKIMVHDIGLTRKQRETVSKYCNVELETLDFAKYPSHVKTNIYSCAWKPLILQELVDQGYDIILYGDASLRMKTHNITPALQYLLDFPFLNLNPDSHSMISFTHDKMIEYLQFPPSRQYMAHWAIVQGGCWLLLVNDVTREKLIAPWVDCALHKECIDPDSARRGGCNFSVNDGTYAGCHMYDQSALNVILVKNFGLKVWDKVVRKEVADQLSTIVRHPQKIYPVKHHPHCNNTEVSA